MLNGFDAGHIRIVFVVVHTSLANYCSPGLISIFPAVILSL